MSDRETWAVKFPSELNQRIHSYRDERGLTKSEALRHLVRDGLESDPGPNTPKDRILSAIAIIIFTGYPSAAAYYGNPDTALVWIGILAGAVLFSPQIDQLLVRLSEWLDRLTDRINRLRSRETTNS